MLCCGCWIIYSKIQNSPFISKHVDRHVKNVVVALFLLPVVCPQLWVLWYPSDLSCYQVTWSPLCTETWSLWIFCWDQPALKILFDRSLIYNHYIIWVIKIIYLFSINHMHINRWLNNQFISICICTRMVGLFEHDWSPDTNEPAVACWLLRQFIVVALCWCATNRVNICELCLGACSFWSSNPWKACVGDCFTMGSGHSSHRFIV